MDARALLQKKKNLRLIKLLVSPDAAQPMLDIRSVRGGLLVQDVDKGEMADFGAKVVTERCSNGSRT